MNPWVRRLLIYLVLSVAGAFVLLLKLPSPREIALKWSEPLPNVAVPVPVPTPSTLMVLGQVISVPGASPDAVPTPQPPEKRTQLKLLMLIAKENSHDVRVCENFGHTTLTPTPANGKDPSVFELFGADRTDSVLEAYRMPLRILIQEPPVAQLLAEVGRTDSAIASDSFMDLGDLLSKAKFYAQVARTGVRLVLNRRKYELLGDRTNHLSTLAKVGLVLPKSREDARVMAFCRRIQGDPNIPTREQIRAERADLLALLKEQGITPKELDFNPEDWTKFSLKRDGGKFTLQLTSKDEASL